jgi:hypothetical protein
VNAVTQARSVHFEPLGCYDIGARDAITVGMSEQIRSERIKKEPGHADVEQRERGDVRQQQQPPKSAPERAQAPTDGPSEVNRNPSSPWLGGG